MITFIVFSYNRALQLDGTLRSFLLHCKDANLADIRILYRSDQGIHQEQYKQLIDFYSRYQNIQFIEEKNFKKDLIRIAAGRSKWLGELSGFLYPYWDGRLVKFALPLPQSGNYLGFLVDDNLFVEDFTLAACIDAFEAQTDVLGFSLRLGKNTTYCYTQDQPQELPEFSNLPGNIFAFQWVNSHADFGYPLEVSSSIYRTKDLFYLLVRMSYNNPNTLETRLSRSSIHFIQRKPVLLCFGKSVTFCAPVNKVQTIYQNRAGKGDHLQVDSLAEAFQTGYRIDVDAYNGFVPNSCHQEVDLVLGKLD